MTFNKMLKAYIKISGKLDTLEERALKYAWDARQEEIDDLAESNRVLEADIRIYELRDDSDRYQKNRDRRIINDLKETLKEILTEE